MRCALPAHASGGPHVRLRSLRLRHQRARLEGVSRSSFCAASRAVTMPAAASLALRAPPASPLASRRRPRGRCAAASPCAAASADVGALKLRLLRASAASDRGQLHNAFVWGADAYGPERAAVAALVSALEATQASAAPPPLSALDGDWELVYASGQLFRSSPFFLAVSEAFGDTAKSELFFRLHELQARPAATPRAPRPKRADAAPSGAPPAQVASFGLSRYGRVEQRVDSAAGVLTSSFTTLLFGLTVVPLIGWGKLLPTLCVAPALWMLHRFRAPRWWLAHTSWLVLTRHPFIQSSVRQRRPRGQLRAAAARRSRGQRSGGADGA